MKILSWITKKIGLYVGPVSSRQVNPRRVNPGRGFNAADQGDRFADWGMSTQGPNESIRGTIKRIRQRSRDLANNNDYMKKFLFMVGNNVIGSTGIKLNMKIKDESNNKLDTEANRIIEGAWTKWGKMETASVTGDLSFHDIQMVAVKTLARDGEVIIRKVKFFDNKFQFALQLIEGDHLDENQNANLSNGNKIRMGIELNQWGKPVAYHIREQHPGDSMSTLIRQKVNRVPAEEIIHLFIKERIGQVRGVPWSHSTMVRMHMIGGYEDAELTGARAAASKMGFFTEDEGGEYSGDGEDAEGNIVSEFSPGHMERLPAGVDVKSFDPGNPSSNFKNFLKSMLRGAASGLNVSYNTLANDLEGVNFSSIRSGVLEERENWKALQKFVIDHLHGSIFPDWLTMAILTSQVSLPMSRFDKFNVPQWQPRGWSWVDPIKDVMANEKSVLNRFKSPSDCAAEQGRDFEEILEQIAADVKLAKEHGIELFINQPASGPLSVESIINSEGGNDENQNG